MPISAKAMEYLQKAITVCAILILAYLTAKLASSILVLSGEKKGSWQKYLQPFRNLLNVFSALIAAALVLRALNINVTGEGIRLVRIVGIIAGAYVISKIVSRLSRKWSAWLKTKIPQCRRQKSGPRPLGKSSIAPR